MKTPLSAVLSALILFVLSAPTAPAQQPSPSANASKFHIAVVDVSYIFKKHAQYRSQMEALNGEMKNIDQQLQLERQKILDKEEEKKSFNVGTTPYKQADDALATMKAQFQLNTQRYRKMFVEKEAKVHYDTYQQVSKAIEYYAKQQGIGLVLQFNGEAADPARPEMVRRDLAKLVQYQNQLDITPNILAMLNRGQAPTVGDAGGRAKPY